MGRRGPAGSGAVLLSFAAAVGAAVGARSVVALELPGVQTLLRAAPLPRETLGLAWSPRALWPADLQAASVERLAGLVAALFLAVLAVALLNALVLLAEAGAARRRELALRAAVGAGPGALLALLARQARALLASGGAVGVLLGLVAGGAIRAGWPGEVDPVGWTAALGALVPVAALLTGLALAAYLWTGYAVGTGSALGGALGAGGRTTDPGGEAFRRRLLAAFQMGTAGAVALGAWTLARSAPSPGEEGGLRTDTVAVPVQAPPGGEAVWGDLLAALGEVEGVAGASLASPGALVGVGIRDNATTQCGACYRGGLPLPFWGARADHHAVAPGYFRAVGMTVGTGRPLLDTDGPGAPRVALVNRTLANAAFEKGAPVGRLIRLGRELDGWYEVVGVVEDGWGVGLGGDDRARPAVYVSALQQPPAHGEILLAASGSGAAAAVRLLADAGVLAGEPRTLARVAEEAAAPLVWMGRLALGLGLVALLLALHGVHATTVQVTRRRAQELAIRRVVGAGSPGILGLVLASTARTAAGGAALALILGSGLTALLRKAASGVPAPGAGTYATLAAAMVLTALLASVQAGREALRIEPSQALE